MQNVDEKLKVLERKNFGKSIPIRVAVVGCGYSGVELAATVSERLQDKGVVLAINMGNTILPDAPSGNREVAQKVRIVRYVHGNCSPVQIDCLLYLCWLVLCKRIKKIKVYSQSNIPPEGRKLT